MIAQVGVWRAANLLIRKHGIDAELEAAKRADLMLNRGDDFSASYWGRPNIRVTKCQIEAR
jgi:hypothetical protein